MSEEIILIEELRNAPEEVQQAYTQWVIADREMEYHEERYLVVADKGGDPLQIDCKGIWTNNVKKLKRYCIYTKELEKEIKRRSDIIFDLKQKKSKYARQWNT